MEAFSIVKEIIDFSPISGIGTVWQAIAYLLTSYLPFYLFVGIFMLAVQFCWLRWRRCNEPVAWELMAVDRTSFFWNWVGLAMLAIVGLPTLSAYCFNYGSVLGIFTDQNNIKRRTFPVQASADPPSFTTIAPVACAGRRPSLNSPAR